MTGFSFGRNTPERLMKPLSRRGFEALIAPHFLPSEQRKIMQAYRLSKHGHQRQVREGGGRYFDHPKTLAIMLVRLGVRDVAVICAALLHDTIEDTFILELADIEEWFGSDTCMIVKLCTKEKKLAFLQYIARMMGGDVRGIIVKCADRVHNLSTLESADPAKAEFWRKKKVKQCRETRKHILPMAIRLSQDEQWAELGTWFLNALTYWVERREAEVAAAA